MNRLLSFSVFLACTCASLTINAQSDYFIRFTDKAETPFSLEAPEEYLGQRAIDRRLTQSIAIDERDLPVDPAYVATVDAVSGVEVKYATKWLNGLVIFCDSVTSLEVAELPMVVSVVKAAKWTNTDELELALSAIDPDDFRLKQSMMIDYGESEDQITDLNGDFLHDLGFEGEGMVMAILDSGFDHVDSMEAFSILRAEGRILSTKDMVQGDIEVYDEHSHGRFVLSTIAGIIEGEAYGTASKASFHLIRTEDAANESTIEELNWVAGAEYADSVGADVLNTSLGYTTFDDEAQNYTYQDMDGNTTYISRGADIAASRGMLVVNSAGNSGASSWHFIGAPADGDSVLAVGAVRGDSLHASFSSFGPSVDGRVKPNVMAKGSASTVINQDDVVFQANGTSFSSPILAGMATCLWQAVPGATNMEVFHAIEQSAHLFSMPNDSMGHGIPDFGLAYQILTGVTSISENEQLTLTAFPNPTEDELNVILPRALKDTRLHIEVSDMTGRQLLLPYELGAAAIRLDCSALSEGLYLLTISSGVQSANIRFLKE